MPDGVSLGAIAAVLIPVGIVTVLLRELPFSAKKWMKDSEFFSLLGLMMPVGVMTILVVYAVAGQADGTGGRCSWACWSPPDCTSGSGIPDYPSSAVPRSTCCW